MDTPKKNYAVNEKYFLLILLMVSSIMLFAAFSSAYWVHKTDALRNNAWLIFKLPVQFWVSTIIIAVSSIFMQLAYRAAKNDEIQKVPALLTFTLIGAIAFCISQCYGVFDMVKRGLFFSNAEAGEISASFLYVLAGTHLAHILGGITLLIAAILRANRLQIHKKNLVFINICKTYWHFLGILWVYLIIFLYFA
ncbi:MAG: cytochrome c oxidase subunit 3 [Bacteroidetes bacterium]|nr:cytochrome c oxidase subunit 3 [Bacteroidota bacterium]